MRRLVWWLVLLYAFAIPWEYAVDLGPPLGDLARVVCLAALACGVLAVGKEPLRRSPGIVQWLAVAFLVCSFCSWFWSSDPPATLARLRGYVQEIAAVWLVWEFADGESDLRALLRAWVAGCWVLASLVCVHLPALRSGDAERFVTAGLDPNDVAHMLTLGIPLAALLLVNEDRPWARILVLSYGPVSLLAVLLTGSRSGLIGAATGIAGSALLLTRHRARIARVSWVVLAAASASAVLLTPAATWQRFGTVGEQFVRGDLNQRVNIWDVGWDAFARAPFFGSGAGTFVAASGLSATDTAHNTFLAIAIEQGIFGLLFFVLLLAAVVRSGWRLRGSMQIALVTLLLVWLLHSAVGTLEQTRSTWMLFGAVSLATRAGTVRLERVSPRRWQFA